MNPKETLGAASAELETALRSLIEATRLLRQMDTDCTRELRELRRLTDNVAIIGGEVFDMYQFA